MALLESRTSLLVCIDDWITWNEYLVIRMLFKLFNACRWRARAPTTYRGVGDAPQTPTNRRGSKQKVISFDFNSLWWWIVSVFCCCDQILLFILFLFSVPDFRFQHISDTVSKHCGRCRTSMSFPSFQQEHAVDFVSFVLCLFEWVLLITGCGNWLNNMRITWLYAKLWLSGRWIVIYNVLWWYSNIYCPITRSRKANCGVEGRPKRLNNLNDLILKKPA